MLEDVSNNLYIRNTTKGKVPTLPFVALKNKILGKKYDLSLCLVGTYKARKINIETRGKTYTPNTLSFLYEKDSGEIIICPIVVRKQAKSNKAKYNDYFAYIFIHSLLHLKGMDHGEKMEKLEAKFLAEFGYKI